MPRFHENVLGLLRKHFGFCWWLRGLVVTLTLVLGSGVVQAQSAATDVHARILAVTHEPAEGMFSLTLDKGGRDGVVREGKAVIRHLRVPLVYDHAALTEIGPTTSVVRVRARQVQDAQVLMQSYEVVLPSRGEEGVAQRRLRSLPAAEAKHPGLVQAAFLGFWILVNHPVIFELKSEGEVTVWRVSRNAELETDPSSASARWLAGATAGEVIVKEGRVQFRGTIKEGRLRLENTEAKAELLQIMELRRLGERELAGLKRITGGELRQRSIEKAVLNNLRMLAAAADQYYLENGVAQTEYASLVGPDKYVKSLVRVDEEDYTQLVFRQGTAFELITKSGIKVRYSP